MGSSQQFSLRWNNYMTHVTGEFNLLRDDENLVDVTLCCEGRKIKAHRMLLSACSSYFREIFQDNPCQHPVIVFQNVKFNDLESIISFMYKGEVNVEQEGLPSFLNTAELLEVKGLTGGERQQAENILSTVQPEVQVQESLGSKHSPPYPESPRSVKKRKVSCSSSDEPRTIVVKPEFTSNDLSDYDDQSYSSTTDPLGQPPNYEDQNSPEDKLFQPSTADENAEGLAPDISSSANMVGLGSSDNSLQDPIQVFAHGLWRRLHPSLKQFRCDECGKIFKHPRSLDHHKKMHEGRTTCPYCQRIFGRMYALRLHISSSHPGLHQDLPLQPTKSH